MTAATNIQMVDHGTTGKNDNNKETVIMKIQYIQSIIQNSAKVLAGIMVGGMIAAASIFLGMASADSPARPSAEVEGASSISSTGLHFPEVDGWVALTYTEKLVTSFNFPEVDDWVALTYSEKLVPANAFGAFDSSEVDDWVALTYSEKLVPANAFGAFDSLEVDDWVALTYSEKLVANFDYHESLILNDNFSMVY